MGRIAAGLLTLIVMLVFALAAGAAIMLLTALGPIASLLLVLSLGVGFLAWMVLRGNHGKATARNPLRKN
jgi:hypothetical protein